jgi:alpha-glucosidase
MTTDSSPRPARRHCFEPTRHDLPKVAPRAHDWWRGAVIYQIYPRSFADADGNGIGDLPGIERRLDYVASLGVDAVWISPFFKSPMKDYGYDVADYCDVDPIFGTLDDFDRVLEKAHRLGLKLLVDFVPSHTSDQHEWFKEARASRTNPRADWYVFADPKPDGTPPNNWLSVFGGPAWEWEPRRGQYYLHNFLKEQPDLNFHNLAVIEALLAQARFWLERGVDGFRLDAIDFGVHDPRLRNNPPRPRRGSANTGGFSGSPWLRQVHLYNKARPELSDLFFKPLFALTEAYEGGRVLLAEMGGDRALERLAEYTAGGGIDMAYSFDLLSCPPDAAGIRGVVDELERKIGDGWVCWSFGNHDVLRAVTRFAQDGPVTPELRKLIPAILVSLRGTPCLYQGEELGLAEADLAYEDLRDPFGLAFWPAFKGRDGCRTPMPWTAEAPHAGFTEGAEPWLPVPPEHLELSVAAQELHADSPLNHVRELLAWRKTQPALVRGSLRFLGRWRELLAFERELDGDRVLCAFNLGRRLRHETLPVELGEKLLAAPGASARGRRVNLPAHGWLFARIAAGEGA